MCSMEDDAGLTSLADSMYLTPTVHCYTQHGCFIISLDIFAIQPVRQESEVCNNYAMGLVCIIQPLHKNRKDIIKWAFQISLNCIFTLFLPVGKK